MHANPRHSDATAFDGDGPPRLGPDWFIHGRLLVYLSRNPYTLRPRYVRQPHPAQAEAAEPFYPVPVLISNSSTPAREIRLGPYCGSILCSRAIADHLTRWASMSAANSAGDVPRVMSPTLVRRV